MSTYLPRAQLSQALIAASFLLVGCASTPEQRIARNSESFNQLPAATQERVRKGEVAVGDAPNIVRLALGEPSRVLQQQSADGVSEVWVYSGNGGPNFSIGLGIGSFGSNIGGGVSTQIPVGGGVGDETRVVFRQQAVVAIERSVANP